VRSAAAAAKEEASGLPGWLLPLVGLALLGALAWWFLGGQPEQAEPGPPVPPPKSSSPEPRPVVAPKITEAPKIELPDLTKFSGDLSGVYTALTDVLKSVKDGPTADAALPKLTDFSTKLDDYKAIWDKLNDAGKAAISKVTTDHLTGLKELVATTLKTPSLTDKFKEIINAILAKLAALATG
jgi:hypothetical protein